MGYDIFVNYKPIRLEWGEDMKGDRSFLKGDPMMYTSKKLVVVAISRGLAALAPVSGLGLPTSWAWYVISVGVEVESDPGTIKPT